MELGAALAFRTGDQARALVLAEKIARRAPDANNPVAMHIISRLSPARTTPED